MPRLRDELIEVVLTVEVNSDRLHGGCSVEQLD